MAHPNGNKMWLKQPAWFHHKTEISCWKIQVHCINVKKNTDKKDLQICWIGAQIHHYNKYAKTYPKEVTFNAALYWEMNEAKFVILVELLNQTNITKNDQLDKALLDKCKDTYFENEFNK